MQNISSLLHVGRFSYETSAAGHFISKHSIPALYHKVRNQYSALPKSARVNYYSNLIDQYAGDCRKLFRVVNSLSREPLETALPEHDDPTKLANKFGTSFLKKLKSSRKILTSFKFKSLDLLLFLQRRIWRIFLRYP